MSTYGNFSQKADESVKKASEVFTQQLQKDEVETFQEANPPVHTYTRLSETEYIAEVKDLYKLLSDFCKVNNIESVDLVQVNLISLQDIIVRVHKRKIYFMVFHKEMEISEYKETALYCYWFLKLRPFWIDPSRKGAERINENFALYLYITLLKRYNEKFSENDGLDQRHIKELKYSFRFRDITKESMILMLEPYYYDRLKANDQVF